MLALKWSFTQLDLDSVKLSHPLTIPYIRIFSAKEMSPKWEGRILKSRHVDNTTNDDDSEPWRPKSTERMSLKRAEPSSNKSDKTPDVKTEKKRQSDKTPDDRIGKNEKRKTQWHAMWSWSALNSDKLWILSCAVAVGGVFGRNLSVLHLDSVGSF